MLIVQPKLSPQESTPQSHMAPVEHFVTPVLKNALQTNVNLEVTNFFVTKPTFRPFRTRSV